MDHVVSFEAAGIGIEESLHTHVGWLFPPIFTNAP